MLSFGYWLASKAKKNEDGRISLDRVGFELVFILSNLMWPRATRKTVILVCTARVEGLKEKPWSLKILSTGIPNNLDRETRKIENKAATWRRTRIVTKATKKMRSRLMEIQQFKLFRWNCILLFVAHTFIWSPIHFSHWKVEALVKAEINDWILVNSS